MSGDPGPFAWWRLIVAFLSMAAVGGGTLLAFKVIGGI